jgi:hypothetical protein
MNHFFDKPMPNNSLCGAYKARGLLGLFVVVVVVFRFVFFFFLQSGHTIKQLTLCLNLRLEQLIHLFIHPSFIDSFIDS